MSISNADVIIAAAAYVTSLYGMHVYNKSIKNDIDIAEASRDLRNGTGVVSIGTDFGLLAATGMYVNLALSCTQKWNSSFNFAFAATAIGLMTLKWGVNKTFMQDFKNEELVLHGSEFDQNILMGVLNAGVLMGASTANGIIAYNHESFIDGFKSAVNCSIEILKSYARMIDIETTKDVVMAVGKYTICAAVVIGAIKAMEHFSKEEALEI